MKVDPLFKNFRTESDITSVNMDTIAMKLALFNKSMGVEGKEILRFNDCNQKESMKKDFTALMKKDQEELMRIKDEYTKVNFYIKQNKESYQRNGYDCRFDRK